MSEIIIVIVVLGLLAAIALPVYNNIRAAGVENVKIKNAEMLNQMITTVHNGGFDTGVWENAESAIQALRGGIQIRTGNTPITVQLNTTITPAAYGFVRATESSPARFQAIPGHPEVNP